MVYMVKGKEGVFIPVDEDTNERAVAWMAKGKNAAEVLWHDKREPRVVYLLTHGRCDQKFVYRHQFMDLRIFSEQYSEELRSEGIKAFYVICCHGYMNPFFSGGVLFSVFYPSLFEIQVSPNSWVETEFGKEIAINVSIKYGGLFGWVKKWIQNRTDENMRKKLSAL